MVGKSRRFGKGNGASVLQSLAVIDPDASFLHDLRMEVRFYIDPETDEPQIHNHGVAEEEVSDVLLNPGEDGHGREGSRVAIGQTASGRYLRVVYVPDDPPVSCFVITAYELRGKPLFAYRRRRKKKS